MREVSGGMYTGLQKSSLGQGGLVEVQALVPDSLNIYLPIHYHPPPVVSLLPCYPPQAYLKHYKIVRCT
jgi:hypothetical protein